MRGLGLWLLGAMMLPAIAPSRPWALVEQYEVVLPRRLPGPRVRRALPSHLGGQFRPQPCPYLSIRGTYYRPARCPGLIQPVAQLRLSQSSAGRAPACTWGLAVVEQEALQAPPGPAPREGELRPWGHRAQLHPPPAEEQGPAGLRLHGDLYGCQWLRGDGAASWAGPLLLPGPRRGIPGLSRQPQHLCRPQVGSDLHLIEPLDEGGEGGRHAVYQAEHLLQTAGTCGVSDDSLGSLLGPRTAAVFRPWPGDSLPSRETRYVELYVVVDNAEFQMLGSEAAVRHRVLEVVNHVDKLYQKLNFRVVLVGLEIWNSQDRFHVSPDPSVTLENLLTWQARQRTRRHLHDNIQLITGVDFTGTTVGFARVSAMCSRSSGAVNQDHSKNPVGVACTMAHEMGHNLGMDHDENVQGCRCRERFEAGRCIMAGSIGSSFPRMFSDCSQAYLESFLEQPQSACLANAPDLSHLVGGPVCGNLFVERGEQCDCGPPEDCRNRCCNSTTCQLAEGAQCAHGTCCQECKVKPAGELCRPKKDMCDLEEFCDGRHPECPEDAFQENGTPCSGGYCYNGACPTLAQQCQAFWGPGGQAAEESCFSYDILPGCKASRYRADMCGTLQCKGGQQPLGRAICIVDVCHALTTEDGTAYEPVPEGTRCGPEKVCWKGRCQDLHVYRSSNCSAQCHNHGVCNHKQECHCHAGWAPPHCAKLLTEVHAGRPPWPAQVGLGSKLRGPEQSPGRSRGPRKLVVVAVPVCCHRHRHTGIGRACLSPTHRYRQRLM
ncbi:ADAM8 isoform 5 [Pan troglodytes]|uniref:ADAM8 isoform 5 n=1 Tax=Pan troglodytes TaxID=9598 RepID=A0A2J8J1L1_PANTR|nr:ADAM8 isoform 5 [Pan troglodytes]